MNGRHWSPRCASATGLVTATTRHPILEQFILLGGYHGKSAIRLSNAAEPIAGAVARRLARTIRDGAVRQALQVPWQPPDRICGKREARLEGEFVPRAACAAADGVRCHRG